MEDSGDGDQRGGSAAGLGARVEEIEQGRGGGGVYFSLLFILDRFLKVSKS
jgi:hypothetical protein